MENLMKGKKTKSTAMNPNQKSDVLKTLLVFFESENIQFEIETDEVNRKVIKIEDKKI